MFSHGRFSTGTMQPSAPSPQPSLSTPAPLWLRLLPGLYDLMPLLGIWFFAGAIALGVSGGALETHQELRKLLTQSLVLAFSAAYFVISLTRGGQTLGLRAWRLRVVRAGG